MSTAWRPGRADPLLGTRVRPTRPGHHALAPELGGTVLGVEIAAGQTATHQVGR